MEETQTRIRGLKHIIESIESQYKLGIITESERYGLLQKCEKEIEHLEQIVYGL